MTHDVLSDRQPALATGKALNHRDTSPTRLIAGVTVLMPSTRPMSDASSTHFRA